MRESTRVLPNLKAELAVRFGDADPDRIVFVGVGNRMRGDDGIGPGLLDLLKEHVHHGIDAGEAPEDYTGILKRLNPEVIVFLDALDWGAAPGQVKIVGAHEVSQVRMGIHKISLEILMDYLTEETGADVFILGIQPEGVHNSPVLSERSGKAVRYCASIILALLEDCER